jgi:hypothetical protein
MNILARMSVSGWRSDGDNRTRDAEGAVTPEGRGRPIPEAGALAEPAAARP